jgi:two-component system phosphate regulon sensor histidine kinase PhoR
MNRRRISIALMIGTIGVIVAFQVFWLRKNYVEEQKTFTIRTNLLFRETLFKMQVARLHLDTGSDVHFQNKAGLITMTNVLKEKVMSDSPHKTREGNAFIISLRHDSTPGSVDSVGGVMYKTANSRVFDFLKGVDSLQDSIPAKEVVIGYRRVLLKEGIDVPFRVTVSSAKTGSLRRTYFPDPASFHDTVGDAISRRFHDTKVFLNPRVIPDSASGTTVRSISLEVPVDPVRTRTNNDDNKVTMGFVHPRVYQLDFDNLFWFTARRVAPQALFSFVLVGMTLLSFLWLYRNWQQQRRLIELKNDFIGNMTHELKTPIATVSVAVEALKNFNALQDPVKTQEYLDISASELQRLSLLVDKVLKLSLFEKEELELKTEEFDLKALVEEVMDSMRLQFEKFRARLTIGAEGSDFSLRADKLHITSVLFNLLDNALKYSKLHPSIRVDVVAEPQQLILSVTDNGMGIPPAYQQKIFEKFFRVPTGDHHNVKGYGLGLSYVSYVLQRQGGRISVESQVGAGSRFTIRIPRNQAPFTQIANHA